MKRLLKKIAAVIATAAIAVSAMVIPTTTASAAGVFDGAKKMEEMEFYNYSDVNSGDQEFYKITIPKDGTINIKWTKGGGVHAELLDSKTNRIGDEFFIGYGWPGENSIHDVNKGTYYLRIYGRESYTAYVQDFYYTFTPTDKPSVKLSITLKKGQTLQLGSILENSKSKTTWLSTKKTVATVSSKGLVTAKKTGKTTIRATLDSGEYAEITVKVTK